MLEKLKSVIVLAIPSDQFNQEPLSAIQSEKFFRKKYNLGSNIFFTEKVLVNGLLQHPLYKWMKKKSSYLFFTKKIRWNYEKFVIYNEKVIARYSPSKILNEKDLQ